MHIKGRNQGVGLVRSSPMRFCRPRMLLVIALIVCWDGKTNSQANAHHHQKNLRLRAPSSYVSQQEQRGTLQQQGVIGSILPGPFSNEAALMGPFIGNLAEEDIITAPRQKKDCSGMPSIAARGMVGPTLKRSYFATTKEEMEEKLRQQENNFNNNRDKREINRVEPSVEPMLPWTCETKYEWHDMGADHYPRFIRTAECKSRSCFNGFFRCRARRYKTKVLKRVSASDSTSCEEDDTSLPETLRSNWKFISVTISLCCDCVKKITGPTEIRGT